jgi:hypothetical protein
MPDPDNGNVDTHWTYGGYEYVSNQNFHPTACDAPFAGKGNVPGCAANRASSLQVADFLFFICRKVMRYSFIGFFFSGITPSASGGQPAQIYYMNKDNMLQQVVGLPDKEKLHIMMGEKDKYNKKMLELIGEILLEEKQYKTRVINLSILEVGMVLGRDLINKDGKIIVKKDVAISDFLQEHLTKRQRSIIIHLSMHRYVHDIWEKVK